MEGRGGGRIYLVRNYVDPATGLRRFQSVGPKSPETERRHDAFLRGRDSHQARVAHLDGRLRLQAAAAKVFKLGHAPVAVGEFFRALSASPARDRVALSGSMAFFAYETLARGSVPSDLLALPEERADLDLFVEGEFDVDEVERLLHGVSRDFRRAPGGHKFASPALTVDCFTRADLAAIAATVYRDQPGGRRLAREFEEAALSATMVSHLVDRSGMVAPIRVLPPAAFAALKDLRRFDPFRGPQEMALDVRQSEAATWLIEKIGVSKPAEEDEEDEKYFFAP